ncbi:hypothetical protein BDW69DRAFT_198300 [Aspergillus filifer]
MPKQDIFDLLPLGWEDDPEEERFKISTLDYLSLGGAEKDRVVEVLKTGLVRTLSQARHVCGTIGKDPTGGHSFVKKRDSTVRFVVQSLDAPEECEVYPSFDDIAEHNFCGSALDNLDDWTIAPIPPGIKFEAHPDSGPAAAAFKVNFIQGGLVFIIHQHHYANDVNGWQLATPPNGSQISTYDAFSAFLWRTVTRLRAPFSKLDLSGTLSWAEGIDMRQRTHAPSPPADATQCLGQCILNDSPWPIHPPILEEVISLWPFSKFASYIRQITNSATQESLGSLSPVRDKPSLYARMARYGPNRPSQNPVYRFLMDRPVQGIVVVYPPRNPDPSSDEGPEFSISYEVALKEGLIGDEEWRGTSSFGGWGGCC